MKPKQPEPVIETPKPQAGAERDLGEWLVFQPFFSHFWVMNVMKDSESFCILVLTRFESLLLIFSIFFKVFLDSTCRFRPEQTGISEVREVVVEPRGLFRIKASQ